MSDIIVVLLPLNPAGQARIANFIGNLNLHRGNHKKALLLPDGSGQVIFDVPKWVFRLGREKVSELMKSQIKNSTMKPLDGEIDLQVVIPD